ncbi:hypothetical protein M1N04_00400 [Peptococcaceae bacterium]|nr:hypothetical protein [Peptococcaceae bacterium]
MIIEVKNVVKIYRQGSTEVRALDRIGLKVEKGEFIVIQAPSGCGKSTLLKSTLLNISGLIIAVITGIIGGLYSAFKAAKMSPAEALMHE